MRAQVSPADDTLMEMAEVQGDTIGGTTLCRGGASPVGGVNAHWLGHHMVRGASPGGGGASHSGGASIAQWGVSHGGEGASTDLLHSMSRCCPL